MDDDDLARLLPEPPPPRPARRDAAIAAAMRRFDGVAEPAVAPSPDKVPPRARAPWRISGGQIGAFASVLLVAGISLTVALQTPSHPPVAARQPAPVPATRPAPTPVPAPARAQSDTPGAPVTGQEAACGAGGCARDTGTPVPGPTPGAAAKPAPDRADAPASPAAVAADGAEADATASRDQVSSRSASGAASRWAVPQAKSAAAEPSEASGGAPIVVTGTRTRQPQADSAMAVTTISSEDLRSGNDIVVTGSLVRRSRAANRRDDWNACTVEDPAQALGKCKRLVDTGAKGAKGEAATHFSAGLTAAWQGDWNAAIEAFDQIIALKPRDAFAYLNRGIAYQRKGDLTRAAADLDLAIKYAPYAARGYYHRGIVRRQLGDVRGAKADADRAVELDPAYADVVE